VIPKAHSLKEIGGSLEEKKQTVGKSGHPKEKFAQHRHVPSFSGPLVQHIEHLFSPLSPLILVPANRGNSLFNILNMYSILWT